jgi:histone H3/H4
MIRKKIPFEILYNAVPKNSLYRMMKEMNILNISELTYEELRGVLKVNLEELLHKINVLLHYKEKKTICINDVITVMDEKILWNDTKLQKCIKGKNTNCLYFPITPFKDLIRLTIQEQGNNYQMKTGVSIIIQYYIEHKIKTLLQKVNLVINNKNKKTLYPKDIIMILKNEEI